MQQFAVEVVIVYWRSCDLVLVFSFLIEQLSKLSFGFVVLCFQQLVLFYFVLKFGIIFHTGVLIFLGLLCQFTTFVLIFCYFLLQLQSLSVILIKWHLSKSSDLAFILLFLLLKLPVSFLKTINLWRIYTSSPFHSLFHSLILS